MAWPNYQQTALRSLTLRELFANVRPFKTAGVVLLVLLLSALYIIGTRLSLLPFLQNQKLHTIIEQTAFLSVIDQLFTGGSLGVLSPFALGILPLLVFRSWTKMFGDKQSRGLWRISFSRNLFFLVSLSLFTLWLVLNGLIPVSFGDITITFFYLLGGSGLLFFINHHLIKRGNLTIVAINAILIAFTYTRALLLSEQPINLGVLALILVYIGSFILFIRHIRNISIVNIHDKTLRWGNLPIPSTNSTMRFALLTTTFIILAVITTFINLFVSYTLSPFGDSLPDILLFIGILTVVSLLLANVTLIDSLLSQFDGAALAHTLMTRYWLLSQPPTPAGKETALRLSYEGLKSHRLNYLFYFVWAFLFSLVGLCAQVFALPLKLLPFGPLGFLIILTLCCELGYALIMTVYRFIRNAQFGELWTSSLSDLSSLPIFTESFRLSEVVEQLLLDAVTDEEKNHLDALFQELEKGQLRLSSIVNMLQTAKQIGKRVQTSQSRETVSAEKAASLLASFFIRFLVCVLFSLIVTLIVLLIIWLVLERTAFSDTGLKIAAVLGLPGTFFVGVPWFGLDETIKSIFRVLRQDPKLLFRRRRIAKNTYAAEKTDELKQIEIAYYVLLRQQRDFIAEDRRAILAGKDIHPLILGMIRMTIDEKVDTLVSNMSVTDEQMDDLIESFNERNLLPPSQKLPQNLEIDRERETLRLMLQRLSVDFYEEQGKQFDDQLALLRKKDPTQDLSYGGIYRGITLVSLRTLERDVWLRSVALHASSYEDQLNAAYRRFVSSSSVQKEKALEQFKKLADESFERLMQTIRRDAIAELLDILHESLSTRFPLLWDQYEEDKEEEVVVESEPVQKTIDMLPDSPKTPFLLDAPETPLEVEESPLEKRDEFHRFWETSI